MSEERQAFPMTGMAPASATPGGLDRQAMAHLGRAFEERQRGLEEWVAHVLLGQACRGREQPRSPGHGPAALAEWLAEIDSGAFVEGEVVRETRELCLALGGAADRLAVDTAEREGGCSAMIRFVDLELALRRRMQLLRERLVGVWAFTDPLTGVYRRELSGPILRREQARVDRGRNRCCVAMLDLDRFKGVNDRFGHAVGDRVLRRAADEIQRHARDYDWLFRYGGEEFLLCLPRIGRRQARQVLERILRSVEGIAFPGGDDGPERITLSAGLASLRPGDRPESAIERADRALYQAKAAGRNRVQW